MKGIQSVGLAISLLAASLAAQNVTLPLNLVDTLDGVKFKIRVPANWNGTLLLYMQPAKTDAPPPEPSMVPPVIGPAEPALETTLIARGYALAASEISTAGWQIKEEVQDTFALAAYFRAKVGNPKRTILVGSSLGGLTALRMIEDYPRSFDGALSMCAPAAGWSRRIDRNLDFAVAYAAVFGWPKEWGTVAELRPGLDFLRDVYPVMRMPAATGPNFGGWEFIRLIYDVTPEALYGTCPLNQIPMFLMSMWASTQMRENAGYWAAGPVAQNRNHHYSLSSEAKTYLAGLGVNADDLLAKMNAQTGIEASPVSREYLVRVGDVTGKISRPVLTMKTTLDSHTLVNHESAYRSSVEFWGRGQFLKQTFVASPGHCAFTSKQILLALAALESWLDTGVKPGDSFFPTADGFDNKFVPPAWPYSPWPY